MINGNHIKQSGIIIFILISLSSLTTASCNFSYSADGATFSPMGEQFTARQGKWVGAKMGIFAVRTGKTRETGYANFDWFRVE
jgi:hypothetical protein